MLMQSYLKKAAVDALLESYYFDIIVTNIAKCLIEPLLKCLTFPAKPIMSFKYPFKKLIKTCNLLHYCKIVKIVLCCRIISFLHELLMYMAYVVGET